MASDQAVTAKDVLDALLRVQRTGPDPLLQELEQCEPDLSEYLMEQTTALHHAIVDLGAKPARTRRISCQIEQTALVLVFALRNAHLRLWQEQHADTPLEELEKPPGELDGAGDGTADGGT